MRHLISPEIDKARVTKWIATATPIDTPSNRTWTERRQAIVFGGHTYLVDKGQVFQCAHCGHYDSSYSAQGVLNFFKDVLGIKPEEIEITCSYTMQSGT